MEATAKSTHPGRAGWREMETERLFSAVQEANAQGRPLRSVFEELSSDLGRKPNSIRNYYYACLREQPGAVRSPAFQPFTQEETHELLRQVLMARGKGMSVRACVMQLSQGSHSRMLRYQNKYRTILKTRPEMIAQVCAELKAEGLPCPETDAPPAVMEHADSAFCDPDDAAAARLMAQPCVHDMLEGIKELLRRAARAESAATPDEKMLRRMDDLQRTVDRQQVQFDLQRIAWERDYDDCAALLKEAARVLRCFISPDEDEATRLAEAHAVVHATDELMAQQQSMLH